jgi:putative tryptophan/tyrosine transport system substrate-binding protein
MASLGPMRRRDFITLLGGAAVAWPLPADAQQPTGVRRVGILSDESSTLATSFEPFAQGLRDLGYVEGYNIAFERRYAENKEEILPSLAAQLIRLQPDVILAVGTPAARAAKSATQAIPIVFARAGDPIALGLVPSLARPGGNLTGLSILNFELEGKRLELLTTAVPDAKRVGALWDPSFSPAGAELRVIESAARSLNLELFPAEARDPDDFETALRAIVRQRAGALIVVPGTMFMEHTHRLVDLAAKAQLPTMFPRRESVEAGGLMSYGTNIPDMYRRAAAYVDKILKGAKPADLPVEQPTKFELVINLKTAKALGLTIPPFILVRADEVIE